MLLWTLGCVFISLNMIENCLQISLISDWISSCCLPETKENLLLKKIISVTASTVFVMQYLTFNLQIPGMPRVMNKRKTDIETHDQMWTLVPLPSPLFCFRQEIYHLNCFSPIGKASFLSRRFHYIFFVFSFQKFNCELSWYGLLWALCCLGFT